MDDAQIRKSISEIEKTQIRDSRKSNPRFPRSSVRILERWLSEHCQSPYPSPEDQDDLKARTGLKRSQISNWFANARKRGKVLSTRSASLDSEEHSRPLLVLPHIANLHPFERWLNLGIEHEAAALDAILDAIAHMKETPQDHVKLVARLRRNRDGRNTNWQYFRASGSSVSSMEIRSYAANVKSVCSEQWKYTEGPSKALSRSIRRRRRHPTQSVISSDTEISKTLARRFQCTFCSERFKTKHDWQRHEKSQHLPLERWTCSPHGSVNVNPATSEITCVFCGTADPNPEHIQEHRYTACVGRPLAERTFYRKDHLRQHLRLMHGRSALLPSMDSWRSVAKVIQSRCGFCDAILITWDDRIDHLAEHFCEGASMSDWVGDWGFDQDVMKILERATLPVHRQEQDKIQSIHDSASVDECDYGLFLDLESSHFDAELQTGYQYSESNDMDENFMYEGFLEPSADTYIPEITYTKPANNVSPPVDLFGGVANDNFGYNMEDGHFLTDLPTENQYSHIDIEDLWSWNLMEDNSLFSVNGCIPDLCE